MNPKKPLVYLIGSLRNPAIPHIGNSLRAAGFDVFDDWFGAGPEADDKWQDYERTRGRCYGEALVGAAARNTFNFDLVHLEMCAVGVLVAPAGKSAHLELGWLLGQGKPGFVLFPDGTPERWDVMYRFANGVFFTLDNLIPALRRVVFSG